MKILDHSLDVTYRVQTLFNTRTDATAVLLLGGKQGDILQLPGIKYLDQHTNLAAHVSDFACI